MPNFTPTFNPIVVHSHLRWSGIWQRPQQIHSRLARARAITFIEEPCASEEDDPSLELSEPTPGVVVVQPRLPALLLRERDVAERTIELLLREAAGGELRERTRDAVHWFYTPVMRSQVLAFSRPAAIVYDCMDELSQFLNPPPGLVEREERLLQEADVVFCGGAALYESKQGRHGNVHEFGCGVDFAHFNSAIGDVAAVHGELEHVPAPRLGYVGAIDERLDHDLLRRIAGEHPEWALLLVGPVVKIDPAILPHGPNVHFLGARGYHELPGLLAGFDVCLMPFALNAATEFINPTKTLEYLSSGRPVVSTPIRDVVRGFAGLVTIADAQHFPEALQRVLRERPHDPAPGLMRARGASWESIVTRMSELVHAAVAARVVDRGWPSLHELAGAVPSAPRPA